MTKREGGWGMRFQEIRAFFFDSSWDSLSHTVKGLARLSCLPHSFLFSNCIHSPPSPSLFLSVDQFICLSLPPLSIYLFSPHPTLYISIYLSISPPPSLYIRFFSLYLFLLPSFSVLFSFLPPPSLSPSIYRPFFPLNLSPSFCRLSLKLQSTT